MDRSVVLRTVAASLLLAAAVFTGCSDDDCAICPPPGGGGGGLSSTVLTPQPTPIRCQDIYVAGTQDVFFLGESGVVLRLKGTQWGSYDTGLGAWSSGIWGTSATDVYAVGAGGTIVHFDGSAWRSMKSNTFQYLDAIHGTAADNIYAVGDNNTVLHYDGTEWSTVPHGAPQPDSWARDVWCAPTGELFINQYRGRPYDDDVVILYLPPDSWFVYELPDAYLSGGLWGTAADNALVGSSGGNVFRFSGSTWALDDALGDYCSAIHGTGANNIWAAGGTYGGNNIIRHYDGSSWSDVTAPVTPFSIRLLGAYSTSELYAASGGEMLSWDGANWSRLNERFVTSADFDAMWGTSAGDIWMHTWEGIAYNFDGTGFTEVSTGATELMYDAWGSGANNIYAVGEMGTIMHFNGSAWSAVNHGLGNRGLSNIWGTAPNDIWVSSYSGIMWHFDGTTWTEHAVWGSDYSRTRGLWGSASDDYYAVVESGSLCTAGVMHYDGTEWTPISLGGHYPKGVHGVSASEVYFTTQSSLDCWYSSAGRQEAVPNKTTGVTEQSGEALIRYNGTTGEIEAIPVGAMVDQVWALGSSNVFVVGEQSDESTVVGHYNGSGITLHYPDAHVRIRDIWGTGSNTLFMAGEHGTLIRVTRN